MADPPVPPPNLAAELKASLQAAVSARGAETVDDLRGSITSIKARCEERIAEAVAAERERCAQLAEQHGVRYLKIEPVATGSGYLPGCSVQPFAVLLRKDDHDRT